MDWQVIAMWLVVGAVVIGSAARIIKRHLFRRHGGDSNGPPCCK